MSVVPFRGGRDRIRRYTSVARRAAVSLDLSFLLALVSLASLAACNRPPSLAGMWSATIIAGNARVPCRFLVSGSGESLQGSFFNGDQKISSAATLLESNAIVFVFPEYGSRLEVTRGGGVRIDPSR